MGYFHLYQPKVNKKSLFQSIKEIYINAAPEVICGMLMMSGNAFGAYTTYKALKGN